MLTARLLAVMLVVLSGCHADTGGTRPAPSPSLEVRDDAQVVERAKRDLASADWQNRRAAVEALGELKSSTASTVSILLDVLEADQSDSVREATARVLGELKDLRALAALTRALTDTSDGVRGEAAHALGELGSQAAPAIPALVEGLQAQNMDTFPRCMGASANALASIGLEATPALIEAASDRTRYSLVEQALAGMGPPVLPVLEEMLTTGGGRAETAAIAMQLMGPIAAPALPSLVAASRSGRVDLMFFRNVVQGLGPSAKAAVPRLIELLGSTEGAERCRVAETLKAVEDRDASVLEALRRAAAKEQGTPAGKCVLDVTKRLEQGGR